MQKAPTKIRLNEEAPDIQDIVLPTLCLMEKARRQREEALFSGTGDRGGVRMVPGGLWTVYILADVCNLQV